MTAAHHIPIGSRVAARSLCTVGGAPVDLPAAQLVHLQLRRFAGCPICDLHLRSFAQRMREVAAAGIRELVVFHAPDAELRPYVADLPFDIVGDPERRLYREFGVETAPRALLTPAAWPVIARAVVHALQTLGRNGRPPPPRNPHGGRLGLPADFLIAPDGTVLARHYGRHAGDQWSVDELLRHAAAGA